jgi:hypothetical protein
MTLPKECANKLGGKTLEAVALTDEFSDHFGSDEAQDDGYGRLEIPEILHDSRDKGVQRPET